MWVFNTNSLYTYGVHTFGLAFFSLWWILFNCDLNALTDLDVTISTSKLLHLSNTLCVNEFKQRVCTHFNYCVHSLNLYIYFIYCRWGPVSWYQTNLTIFKWQHIWTNTIHPYTYPIIPLKNHHLLPYNQHAARPWEETYDFVQNKRQTLCNHGCY